MILLLLLMMMVVVVMTMMIIIIKYEYSRWTEWAILWAIYDQATSYTYV